MDGSIGTEKVSIHDVTGSRRESSIDWRFKQVYETRQLKKWKARRNERKEV